MSISENSSLSFWDYKIDYSNRLGSGAYGTVYGVIKRPENEKGYLPYLIPYIYDYVFASQLTKEENKTDLCIKVSKTIFGAVVSLEDVKCNTLMQKHGLTTVQFYKTESLYSQFKTIVNGHTFQYYLVNNYFSAAEQYPLRESFVCFLDSILKSKIDFWDFHGENIMYDEMKVRWEVVDGAVSEQIDSSVLNDDKNYLYRIFCYLELPSQPGIRKVFHKLFKVATHKLSYNEEMDQKLIKKVELLKTIL